jgi:dolichol-phosphate mannosyltransferase
MLPRRRFEDLAAGLTGQGFKILLDILLTARPALRVREIPYHFHERQAGRSKMDALVLAQFAALLIDKILRGLVPLRFLAFAAVGGIGVLVHLGALYVGHELAGLDFSSAQKLATLVAMAANFQLNNSITYRDQRLRGAKLWRGLLTFILVCGLGAVANIGIAQVMYADNATWTLAGATGAAVGVVWNYAVSATLVWRAR